MQGSHERGEIALDLRHYLRVIWRRRWSCAAILAVTVASAVGFTAVQEPIFQATATILIEPEAPKVVNIPEVAPATDSTDQYYATQYKIIQSRPVVDRVIQRLRLKERMPWIGTSNDAYRSFLAWLVIEPVKNTRLLLVRFEDPDPNLAAEVANGLANEYVDYNLELRNKTAKEAVVWLNEQMRALRVQAQDSTRVLQAYQARADLLGIQEQRQLTQQKMADINRAYLDAQNQRLAVEAKLRELTRAAKDPRAAESIFIVANDPLIQKLKTEASDLQVERSKLAQISKPKHPDLLQLDAQIKQVNERLHAELQKLVRAVETELRVARAREENLLESINELRKEARKLNEREAQAVALQRDKDSTDELHAAVLKRLKETGVATALEANNVRVVEAATPPIYPIRPRTRLIAILSVVGGLALGIGAAFLAESLDNKVRSARDVERAVGLPVLGVVPVFQVRPRR